MQCVIDTTLKALRAVAGKAEAARFARDTRRVKPRGFKDDVLRRIAASAIYTAHHSRDCQRFFCIGDKQLVARKGRFAVVEQAQGFARIRLANDDAALHFVRIESVQRRAEGQHNVVGDVHHRIVGADTGAAQSFGNLRRRRAADVNATDNAREVTRAILRRTVFDGQRCIAGNGGVRRFQRWQAVIRAQFLAAQLGDFPREAEHGEAVSTIRRQININDGIVQAQVVADVGTNRRVFRQDKQPSMFIAQPQFARRAEHAE